MKLRRHGFAIFINYLSNSAPYYLIIDVESEMCPTSADYPDWCMNHYCVYIGCGPVGSIQYLYYLLQFVPAKTTHKSVRARELHTFMDIYQGLSNDVTWCRRLSDAER